MVIVDWTPFDHPALGAEKSVPKSSIHGIVVDLDVRVNLAEHRRRRRAGLVDQLPREVLNRLTGLPVNWVPTREVDLNVLTFLDHHARDTIEIRHGRRIGTQVRRVANPPLTIDRITVHARDWERGFEQVNALAGLAQRRLVLSADPADRQLAELESSVLGIGLAIDRAGDLQTLVEPAPFMPEVFTTLAWQVAEQVYAPALERGLL